MRQKELAAYIDHTNLKPQALPQDIRELCAEAKQYGCASVCIAPVYVPFAAAELRGSSVKVGTVCGFPTGMIATAVKEKETALAVAQGADEIDMVLPIGCLKAGEYRQVLADICGVVQEADKRIVKVIIECCYLTQAEKITAVKLIAEAGAHFVKTSTGMGPGGATVEDVILLRKTAGNSLGVKAAGGIRDLKTALAMIEAGADRLGISASSKILQELDQKITG